MQNYSMEISTLSQEGQLKATIYSKLIFSITRYDLESHAFPWRGREDRKKHLNQIFYSLDQQIRF